MTQPPRQEFPENQVLWVSGDCKVLRADESLASPSASCLTESSRSSEGECVREYIARTQLGAEHGPTLDAGE